jgi:hypothetical protein
MELKAEAKQNMENNSNISKTSTEVTRRGFISGALAATSGRAVLAVHAARSKNTR